MSFQKRDKIFIKRSVYFRMSLSVGISSNGLQRGHIVMHSHDRITLFLCYQNYILKFPVSQFVFYEYIPVDTFFDSCYAIQI